jgi:glycerol-3-phosphate dehydrogenase (NAD(P)+)
MTTRTVTILGAGAMGSALATPLVDAGWAVNLWGTWLDEHLLEACRRGEPHPRTGVPLAESTSLFDAADLDGALDGAELAVLAVASAGVEEVTRRAARGLAQVRAVLLTSKGFAPDAAGRIRLLPDAIRDIAAEQGVALPPVIAVGGPCKANEVAARRPTAAVFAAQDKTLAEEIAKNVATHAYRAQPCGDESGVEICAPMKNVYAIALGVCDGLSERGGEPFHDLKAATFTAAVRELMLFTELVGGDIHTAIGLAGSGDLEVTGNSGRNKVYGVRIGTGESATAALAAMQAEEKTVEGVQAAALAARLVDQRAPQLWPALPLFQAIQDILAGHEDSEARITDAVLPRV